MRMPCVLRSLALSALSPPWALRNRSGTDDVYNSDGLRVATTEAGMALRLLHGAQPLIYRCNLYRLSFVLRQGAAQRHAN
jgi:hypothetical protein